MSQTSHSSSRNPVSHDRLLCLSVASCNVHKSVHCNGRGDCSGDCGIYLDIKIPATLTFTIT